MRTEGRAVMSLTRQPPVGFRSVVGGPVGQGMPGFAIWVGVKRKGRVVRVERQLPGEFRRFLGPALLQQAGSMGNRPNGS